MVSAIVNDQVVLFDTWMELKQVQTFRVCVDLGVMVTKVYSINLKAPPSNRLVSYSGHLLCVGWGLNLFRDAVGVFYSPNRLDWKGINCHR